MGAIVNVFDAKSPPLLTPEQARDLHLEEVQRKVGRQYTLRPNPYGVSDRRYRQISCDLRPENVATTFSRWEECLCRKFELLPDGEIQVELFWPAAEPFSWEGLIDEIRQRGLRQPKNPAIALLSWPDIAIPVDTPIIFPHDHKMSGHRRQLIVMEKDDPFGISLTAPYFDLEQFMKMRRGKVQFVGLV